MTQYQNGDILKGLRANPAMGAQLKGLRANPAMRAQ
jgi:hypothetical protein